jgi:hypothetical protein
MGNLNNIVVGGKISYSNFVDSFTIDSVAVRKKSPYYHTQSKYSYIQVLISCVK